MPPKQVNPNTGSTIKSLRQFNNAVEQITADAGMPKRYSMDDPERPFTPEYETPVEPADEQAVPTSTQIPEMTPLGLKPGESHPDRTSEAARDQGWGPVDLPETTKKPKARTSNEKNRSAHVFDKQHAKLQQDLVTGQHEAFKAIPKDEKERKAERARQISRQLRGAGQTATTQAVEIAPVQEQLES